MYFDLFTELFKIVERLTGETMLFKPIYYVGLEAIVMDMDSKQYRGKIARWLDA